jgi:hypothetical protein
VCLSGSAKEELLKHLPSHRSRPDSAQAHANQQRMKVTGRTEESLSRTSQNPLRRCLIMYRLSPHLPQSGCFAVLSRHRQESACAPILVIQWCCQWTMYLLSMAWYSSSEALGAVLAQYSCDHCALTRLPGTQYASVNSHL